MGAERSIDWHGEWACTHGLLLEAYQEAFGTGAKKKGNTKPKADELADQEVEQRDGVAPWLDDGGDAFGEAAAVGELLPEPTPEMSPF